MSDFKSKSQPRKFFIDEMIWRVSAKESRTWNDRSFPCKKPTAKVLFQPVFVYDIFFSRWQEKNANLFSRRCIRLREQQKSVAASFWELRNQKVWQTSDGELSKSDYVKLISINNLVYNINCTFLICLKLFVSNALCLNFRLRCPRPTQPRF